MKKIKITIDSLSEEEQALVANFRQEKQKKEKLEVQAKIVHKTGIVKTTIYLDQRNWRYIPELERDENIQKFIKNYEIAIPEGSQLSCFRDTTYGHLCWRYEGVNYTFNSDWAKKNLKDITAIKKETNNGTHTRRRKSNS